ncbi:hypothetical protein EPJ66_10660 [Brachyspira aalborgi]|mgnify:FL=1|uniref:Uncharacterized protein n=1 Tax=Brachyspira aalborgi TaxID=29522 RepID=A0A5C8EC87_9SPIR|nr:hypothetical protein [Brachyspira aalborgi]TXJ35667.1 hypothetical protein EPJ81_11585 [Brachyspira aalborgi]TXJ50158.1 hypothetical protein EPJ66_10660 [Brachyspira aalborgi]
MSKIKKIIILSIIVAVVYFVISFITSDVGKILRENTLAFEEINSITYINLNYVQNLEGPVEYRYKRSFDREFFGEYKYVFNINFINGYSIKITNFSKFQNEKYFRNLKRFEAAAEKIKYDEIETINYGFHIKSDNDKDYTELNFKDIMYFVTVNMGVESYLYFYSIKYPYTYEFTYEQPATAEGIINIRKGYKVKELDNTTGRPLTNKDDDF